MHVGFGLQLHTPAGPASQRPKSTTRSQVLFFFFVPLDNKGKEKKGKEKPQEKQQQQQQKIKQNKKTDNQRRQSRLYTRAWFP